MAVLLACPLCRAPLANGACERCGAYPSVGGVAIVIPQPTVAITELREATLAAWAQRQVAAAALTRATNLQADRDERARAIAAMDANYAILRDLLAPVFKLAPPMSERAPKSALAEILACDDGWTFDKTLPYFHADWSPSSESRSGARESLLADVERYVRSRGTTHAALVLGCAGGRLVHDLAATLGYACGVDRSIAPLLFARRLLDGESFTGHLEEAAWRSFTLHGARQPAPGATLVAGDAAALPFASGSFSVVVTQYLLDIVGDPENVLREINRVLAPGGTWIHLGLPFRLRDEPGWLLPHTDAGWPALAGRFGFDVLAAERSPTPYMALSELDPWAAGDVHQCVHAVAQKAASLPSLPGAAAIESFFAGDPAPLLALAPSLDEPVEVLLRHGRGGRIERRILHLGRSTFSTPDEDAFARAVAFLDALDGTTSFGDVVRAAGAAPRDAALALEGLRRAGHVKPR